jgi:hypothetical protein
VISWLNLAVLVFASLFFLYFYVLRVSPVALEKVIGMQAYQKCGRYRIVAMIFEIITALCKSAGVQRLLTLPAIVPSKVGRLWSPNQTESNVS